MLVLVTGASKGIGYEVVSQLSKNPKILVIAISRNTKSLYTLIKEQNTSNVLPVKADITNGSHRKKIVDIVKKLNLKVDVLINNAGEIVNKPFSKISEKELLSVYSTNVFAPFQLVQQLLPLLNVKNGAHIVNMSSMGGFQGTAKFAGLTAYSSSKAALCGLTECLAQEFKGKRISVNCLAIGAVQTEMLMKAFPGYKAPLQPKQMAEYVCDFALTGQKYFNGKIIPVSLSTP